MTKIQLKNIKILNVQHKKSFSKLNKQNILKFIKNLNLIKSLTSDKHHVWLT